MFIVACEPTLVSWSVQIELTNPSTLELKSVTSGITNLCFSHHTHLLWSILVMVKLNWTLEFDFLFHIEFWNILSLENVIHYPHWNNLVYWKPLTSFMCHVKFQILLTKLPLMYSTSWTMFHWIRNFILIFLAYTSWVFRLLCVDE